MISSTRLILAGLAAGVLLNVSGMASATLLGLGEAFARFGIVPTGAGVLLHLSLRFGVGVAATWVYVGMSRRYGAGMRTVLPVSVALWTIGYVPATALLHEVGLLGGGQAVASAAWGLLEVCAALALAATLTRRSVPAASGRGGIPAVTALLLVVLPVGGSGQQVADTAFAPAVPAPTYAAGAGPVVAIDAAHANFHTMEGRYASFARLLRSDGYRVRSNEAPFTPETLARSDVLVISNAMHEQSADEFAPLPNVSAFTEAEIGAVEAWVADGGALMLIADHMPIAGHAEALAAAFGIRFHNGFVFGTDGEGRITFRRSDGSLRAGTATEGRGPGERVDSVTTFTGQAFRLDAGVDGEEILVLSEGHTLLLPSVAWEFSDATPRIQAVGLLQGALVRHGRGRVAVFGEAAMFGAQLAGPAEAPMGMNHPSAAQNPLFALNVLHWLSAAPSGG